MAEAIGKTFILLAVFISGMSTTIMLEKVKVFPATCYVAANDQYDK